MNPLLKKEDVKRIGRFERIFPKRSFSSVLLLGIGYGLGFMTSYVREAPVGEDRSVARGGMLGDKEIVLPAGADERQPKGDSGSETDRMIALMQTIPRLPPDDFAERLQNLMKEGLTPDEMIEQAIMFSTASLEQGLAFYRIHHGAMGIESSKEFRDFMLGMGWRNGQAFFEGLSNDFPNGFFGIDSLTHGWANKDPKAAVDWLNALPDQHPSRSLALRGIMWGLGQKDPDTAIFVFNGLHEDDLDVNCVNAFANSLIANSGFGAVDQWLATGPSPGLTRQVLEQGVYRGIRRPPEEFVPWVASKLEEFPSLSRSFDKMSETWARQDPAAALAWLDKEAAKSDTGMAVSALAVQLHNNGQSEAIAAWLENNPSAPGSVAIREAIEPSEASE